MGERCRLPPFDYSTLMLLLNDAACPHEGKTPTFVTSYVNKYTFSSAHPGYDPTHVVRTLSTLQACLRLLPTFLYDPCAGRCVVHTNNSERCRILAYNGGLWWRPSPVAPAHRAWSIPRAKPPYPRDVPSQLVPVVCLSVDPTCLRPV